MLKAELYKYLKNKIFLITLLIPIIFVLILMFLIPATEGSKGMLLYAVSRNLFYSVLIPAYIIIICNITKEMEQKNKSWIILLTMPIKKISIYLYKILLLMAMVFVNYIGYLIGVGILKIFYGDITLSFQEISLDLLISFVCTFAIVSFFYVFSLEMVPSIVYLGIGTVMILAGFLASQSEQLWIYCPMSYPVVVTVLGEKVFKWILVNIAIGIVFHIIGALRFSRREWF